MIENLADLSLDEKRALARQLLRDRNKQDAGLVPLSEGQRALWFVYQLAPRSPARAGRRTTTPASEAPSPHPLLRSRKATRRRRRFSMKQ